MSRSMLIGGILALLAQAALAGNSEFIDDLPPLTQDPDRAGAMIWQKPGIKREDYTRVMIEPVTIFISPDSAYQGLNADELKALADGFHEALTQTLEPAIPVVNARGPGVAYLRAALTNVKLVKKKRGLLGYTPIGLIVTAARDAAGARISLDDAVLEIELLDSASGERLGVLVDKAPRTAGDELSWESIKRTFVYYAERFKARMQAGE